MPLDPVTAGLTFADEVIEAGIEHLHATQTRRLDAAEAKARSDVQDFKNLLLGRDLRGINLALGGMQHGIEADLTADEYDRLGAISFASSGLAALGAYCRARYADLAAERAQIIADTASTRAVNPS